MKHFLTALPVYNEQLHVTAVLDQVVRYSEDVLVVDDGSSDGTAELLSRRDDILVAIHGHNRGYGAALQTAFRYAMEHDYDVLVTIDCDGQHEPQRIPQFVETCRGGLDDGPPPDIVSGSRYLEPLADDVAPPEERRQINMRITAELNRRLGLNLTDAFCGFKAYRVASLRHLKATDVGYAMPLQLWVLAACAGLQIMELPVPLIYLEEKRSFGGELDDGQTRLDYYHRVIQRSLEQAAESECSARMLCGEGSR